MLAQELDQAEIIALDIEEQAFLQTQENFSQSPWQERLTAVHCAVQSFDRLKNFEAIICNPPFFHKHLNSTASNRNLARHDEGLSKAVLAEHISNLLSDTGSCCLLYPASEWQAWTEAARQNNLFATNILHIQPYPDKAHNRVIGFFGKKEIIAPTPETITIYTGPGKAYTPEFTKLLEPYYLHI